MRTNEDYINEATKECQPPTAGNMEMIPLNVVVLAMDKMREDIENDKK